MSDRIVITRNEAGSLVFESFNGLSPHSVATWKHEEGWGPSLRTMVDELKHVPNEELLQAMEDLAEKPIDFNEIAGTPLVYVSGQITGVKNSRERFGAASELLERRGYEALNPYSVSPCTDGSCEEWPGNPRSNGHTWACWLRFDLVALLQCDMIFTLPGWEKSRGAVLEVQTALGVGIPVHHLTWADVPPAVME